MLTNAHLYRNTDKMSTLKKTTRYGYQKHIRISYCQARKIKGSENVSCFLGSRFMSVMQLSTLCGTNFQFKGPTLQTIFLVLVPILMGFWKLITL